MQTLKRRWWLILLLAPPVAFVAHEIDLICVPSLEPLSPGVVEGHLVFQTVCDGTNLVTPVALDLSSFDLQVLPEWTYLVDPNGEWILVGTPRHAYPPTLLTAEGERKIELVETVRSQFGRVFAGQCGAPWIVGWPVQVDSDVDHDAVGRFATYDLKQNTERVFDTPWLDYYSQWCITDQGDELYASVDGVIGHYEKGMPPRTIGKGWRPAWSPTGGLAFISYDRERIMVMATGGKQRILEGPGTRLVTVVWAPDGEHLAFVCDFPGRRTYFADHWRIGVINVQTGQMWQVMPNDSLDSKILSYVFHTRSLQWTTGILDIPKGSSEEE